MAAVTGSDKYSRVETFLDNIDQVRDPSNLEEPFRSLWLRAHGDMPTLMSEDDTRIAMSSFGTEQLSDVEITSADGDRFEVTKKSSIEVVSPKDIGPTVEMKVEDKRVRFKAAGEEELMAVKAKEEAAGKVVSIQKGTAPLKGIGGVAAKVTARVREMALNYRDGKFEEVIRIAGEIENTIGSDDFRGSILIEIQKKISEYETLGGDLDLTKERFKELSSSFKEGREDFLGLAQAANKLAEDSIKDLVTIEDVVLVEVKEPSQKKKEEPKVEKKEDKAIPPKKEKPKLPGETGEKKDGTDDKEEEPAVKPVIKIIKKKVVVLKMRDDATKAGRSDEVLTASAQEEATQDEEGEDFSIDLEKGEEDAEEVPRVDKIMAQQNSGVKKALEKASKDDLDKTVIDGAFKKIQIVYKASVKLHEQGKDVANIFSIMNMAEQARQKGDMKMYVGLAGQLESMLIVMQK